MSPLNVNRLDERRSLTEAPSDVSAEVGSFNMNRLMHISQGLGVIAASEMFVTMPDQPMVEDSADGYDLAA